MSEVIPAKTGFVTNRFVLDQAPAWAKPYSAHAQRNL